MLEGIFRFTGLVLAQTAVPEFAPRLMVRLLALVLSLIGIVSSGISIYQSVETAYTVQISEPINPKNSKAYNIDSTLHDRPGRL